MAESPPYMYSSGSTPFSSTQPVPVVVITRRTLRSNAPVRCNSATASAARSRDVGAESSPA